MNAPIHQNWLDDITVVVEVTVQITRLPDEVTVEKIILRKGDVEIDILPVLSDELIEDLRIKAFTPE